jgi:hypothetical protein
MRCPACASQGRFDAVPLIAFTAPKEIYYALRGRAMRSMIPRVGLKRADAFRKNAVRIALTSGLTRKQVAGGLCVGMSALNVELVQPLPRLIVQFNHAEHQMTDCKVAPKKATRSIVQDERLHRPAQSSLNTKIPSLDQQLQYFMCLRGQLNYALAKSFRSAL